MRLIQKVTGSLLLTSKSTLHPHEKGEKGKTDLLCHSLEIKGENEILRMK